MNLLIHYFKQHASKYQYVDSDLFQKYFCRGDNYVLKCKAKFDCTFKEWKSWIQPKFHFNVQTIEAAQEHTKVLTKIDEFPPFTLTDKEPKRILKNVKIRGKNRRYYTILNKRYENEWNKV